MKSLQDWRPGIDVRNTQRHQDPIEAIRELQATAWHGGPLYPNGVGIEGGIGKIVAEGPDADADYADCRYWVQRQYMQSTDFRNLPSFDEDDNDETMEVGEFEFGEVSVVTMTNLAERANNSHGLAAGTYVWWWVVWDRGDPNTRHYVFSHALGNETALVLIDQNIGPNAYRGKTWSGSLSALPPAGGLDLFTYGMTLAASSDAVVYDLQPYGTEVLFLPQNVTGQVIGKTNDGRKVVVINNATASASTSQLYSVDTLPALTGDQDFWSAGNGVNDVNPADPAVVLRVCTRVYWDGVNYRLYAFHRELTIDGLGHIINITDEANQDITFIDFHEDAIFGA